MENPLIKCRRRYEGVAWLWSRGGAQARTLSSAEAALSALLREMSVRGANGPDNTLVPFSADFVSVLQEPCGELELRPLRPVLGLEPKCGAGRDILQLLELRRIWPARWRRSWVTGVDKIWPQQNTDDVPFSHTAHARGSTSSTKGPQMRRQDQRRAFARRPEETLVCTGGAQRAGPTPHCHAGRQPRPGTRRGRRRRPRTLLFHDQLFFCGRESELGGGPFYSGADVSGPAIFSHLHEWHFVA